MTPEQWQKIRPILESALEQSPANRPAFLDGVCPDAEVRREVESLMIASPGLRSSFLESSAVAQVIPIDSTTSVAVWTAGMKLGPYEIQSLLGAGGMGEVYRACDTRLDRTVAIKVLPRRLSSDPAPKQRLEREARAIAALQHANICTLFDVGHHDGIDYLVMEFLEGETLSARLSKMPLPLEYTLRYGIEIADALETAHHHGIVHRDLKPGNIMVTAHGECKILDFGLAKLGEEKPSSEPAVTRQETLTSPGQALGTVAYMSPEQARGETLDARTDIFSLGAVLYEMTTGKMAFAGKTSAVVFKAILDSEPPPPSEINKAVPERLDEVIGKCIEKDRELRYQSAAEVRTDLKRLRRDSESARHRLSESGKTISARKPSRWWWFVVASVAAAICASVVWRWGFPTATPHRIATEMRVTSNSPDAPIKWAVISLDGKYLAYTDPTGMYLRVLATGETRQWKLPPGFIADPNSWFPDGTHLLAKRLDGPMKTPSLWKLSMLGGSAVKLLDNAGPGWVSPDGSRIAFLRVPEFGHELWVMGSDGSNPHRIAIASESDGSGFRISQIFPVTWSPDSRRIAYIERASGPSPSPAEDALFSLRTSDASGGDLQVILNDARLRPAFSWPEKNRILFAYQEDVASEHSDEGVRSIGVDPRSGKAPGPIETVTKGPGSIGGMSSTSDGKRLVLWRMNTQFQGYVAEFDPKTRRLSAPRRVTLDANGNVAEAWLPDGRTILFVSNRNGTWNLYKQAIDETTADLLAKGRSIFLPRLSADGSQILYESRADPEHFSTVSLLRIPLGGGPPKLVLQEDGIYNYQCARLPSTLCLLSKQQGSDHVFSSFDVERGMGGEVLRISGGPNDWTLSPDGRTLAVFPGDHRIRFFSFVNGVARETKTVTVNDWKIEQGDWSPDGKVILMESYTASGRSVIMQVDRAGQASVLLEGEANVEFWWIFPSPDGRYGIIEEKIPGDNNAWMLDGF